METVKEFIRRFKDEVEPEVLSVVEDIFRKYDKIASGRTLRSTRLASRIRKRDGGVSVQVRMREGGIYIVQGRSPSATMPPPRQIKRWLRAKGLSHLNEYAVAKNIGRRGFEGIGEKFYEEMDRRSKPIIDNYVTENVGSVLRSMISFTR